MAASKTQPDRTARPEFKRATKDLNAFTTDVAFLDALERTASDKEALAAAKENPRQWLKRNKLTLPARTTITLEERPPVVARATISVTVCVTVCATVDGYTACLTVCVRVSVSIE